MMRPSSSCRSVLVLCATLPLVLGAAVASAQPCDPGGADARAIERVRATISENCGCSTSGIRGKHLHCASAEIRAAVADGVLREECRASLRRYVKRSVCNAGTGVVCCVTDADGVTRGSVKRKAERCRAPAGGSACVSDSLSVVGACADGGCVPACGNGIVEIHLGETCDPPNGTTCDAACTEIAKCGNGIIEPGEECDGQPNCGAGCKIPTTLCCQYGEYCFEGGSDHGGVDDYFFWKGCSYFLGSGVVSDGACHVTGPGPSPGPTFLAAGTCEGVSMQPVQLCCQEAGWCRETTAASFDELAGFGCSNWILPPEIGPLRWPMMGSCGGDGRCIPAS